MSQIYKTFIKDLYNTFQTYNNPEFIDTFISNGSILDINYITDLCDVLDRFFDMHFPNDAIKNIFLVNKSNNQNTLGSYNNSTSTITIVRNSIYNMFNNRHFKGKQIKLFTERIQMTKYNVSVPVDNQYELILSFYFLLYIHEYLHAYMAYIVDNYPDSYLAKFVNGLYTLIEKPKDTNDKDISKKHARLLDIYYSYSPLEKFAFLISTKIMYDLANYMGKPNIAKYILSQLGDCKYKGYFEDDINDEVSNSLSPAYIYISNLLTAFDKDSEEYKVGIELLELIKNSTNEFSPIERYILGLSIGDYNWEELLKKFLASNGIPGFNVH